MASAAPDFTGGYPSAGEMIGPAWQLAWDVMADGRECHRLAIVDVMTSKSPIKEKTAENLLRRAVTSGLLTVTRRDHRRRPYLRRSDVLA